MTAKSPSLIAPAASRRDALRTAEHAEGDIGLHVDQIETRLESWGDLPDGVRDLFDDALDHMDAALDKLNEIESIIASHSD